MRSQPATIGTTPHDPTDVATCSQPWPSSSPRYIDAVVVVRSSQSRIQVGASTRVDTIVTPVGEGTYPPLRAAMNPATPSR
jgi:hypothetical protein